MIPIYGNHAKCYNICGLLCRKQVSGSGIRNYNPQYRWDVISCPCTWYLLLAHKSSYEHMPLFPKWIGLIGYSLHWRHNDHDGVSNHQPHGCLLNRLFGRRSKKTSKLRVTGLCAGNSPGPVNSPHKGPVTRKMFPFHDVIMKYPTKVYQRHGT